ncbi:NAD-dependent epimerase/dehydratase family protein [Mesorhizobium sp. NPDC059054]|uniref:NAD-dependent epimerase/dehydratase family protein n=1 Tax=Mesorhizobium sp. NPDC059054 TaxID=3346711 RepID=UPI003698E51A
MIKVLITGGAGFIGSHLSKLLIVENIPIRIVDSLSPQIHGALPEGLDWLADERVEFIRGSITDRQTLEAALSGITHVIHLAAETGTGQSMYEMARYNEINSQGTALLLDILANRRDHGVQRLILSSSRSVYGEGAYVCQACGDSSRRIFPGARSAVQLAAHQWNPQCPHCEASLVAVPTRENDPVRPASIYAATKYAQEDLVRVACDALGIGYAILRLQNVYGEGQSLKNPYTGILSIFSTRIRRGLELPIFEDGLETRDFVHVEDVARAMCACITSPEPVNKVINVGSGIGTSVTDVARLLAISLQRDVPIRVTSQFRLGDIRHNVADITLLRELVQGGPQVALADGLDRFTAWVLTQPLPEDGLERANAELRARKLMA